MRSWSGCCMRRIRASISRVPRAARNWRKAWAIDPLFAQLLYVESDLHLATANYGSALALASEARNVAKPLSESKPGDREPLQVLYDATIRVGNALAPP